MIRYRRRRTSQVRQYNPWDWDAEPGDLAVDSHGTLYRLEESTGWGKNKLGELTPRKIKPPKLGMKARIIKGEVYWVDPT